MTFLPIVERELRLRSRKRSTYWVRAGAALIAAAFTAVFGLIMYIAALIGGGGAGKVGFALFITLAWMTFIICLIEGARSTADCLSEEKREGTLGLLFLTDLRSYDVVLGKFVAASVNSFYGVMAMFPILGTAMLLGGVAPGQFWRMTLVLCDTLFLALAAGVFVSALCRRQSRAWMGTLGLIAGVTILTPLLNIFVSAAGSLSGTLGLTQIKQFLSSPSLQATATTLSNFSPATAFLQALASGFGKVSGGYWLCLLEINVLGWSLLALASVWLPRSWQDAEREAKETSPWYAPTYPMREAAREARAARRTKLLDVDPVMWLAARDGGNGAVLWLTVLIGAAGAILMVGFGGPSSAFLIGYWFVPVKLVFEVWLTVRVCRFFAEARTSGALELFLTTPLNDRDIVNGQLRALKVPFLAPVVALAATQVVVQVISVLMMSDKSGLLPMGIYTYFSMVIELATFALALLAIIYFGMWMALVLKKPGHALGATLLAIVVLPLPLSLLCFGMPKIAIYLLLFLLPKFKLESELRRRVAGDMGGYGTAVIPAVPLRPPPLREAPPPLH